MGTPLKNLGPSEAFDDAVARSVAAAAGGFLVFGSLQAAGVLPTIYRESLFVASGMLAAFLTTLTGLVAYYHGRWKLGIRGVTLSFALSFFVNIMWAKFSDRSLIYPMMVLASLWAFSLWLEHRKISGPRWDGEIEEELIKNLVDSNFTWKDRVTCLCFISGAILLPIVLLH